jgi:hypothetical protein
LGGVFSFLLQHQAHLAQLQPDDPSRSAAAVTMDALGLAKVFVKTVVRMFYETEHIVIVDALVFHGACVPLAPTAMRPPSLTEPGLLYRISSLSSTGARTRREPAGSWAN